MQDGLSFYQTMSNYLLRCNWARGGHFFTIISEIGLGFQAHTTHTSAQARTQAHTHTHTHTHTTHARAHTYQAHTHTHKKGGRDVTGLPTARFKKKSF